MEAKLTLFTRSGCHLCEIMKAQLAQLRRELPFLLEEIDIAADPKLEALFGLSIPVLQINGKTAFKGHMKLDEFASKFHRMVEGE